jgi:hypothetical protein
MKEVNTTEIIQELTEANLELTSLQMVLGVLMIFQMTLKIHTGSEKITAELSTTIEHIKGRISEISVFVEEKKPIVVKLTEMLLANPVTFLKQ